MSCSIAIHAERQGVHPSENVTKPLDSTLPGIGPFLSKQGRIHAYLRLGVYAVLDRSLRRGSRASESRPYHYNRVVRDRLKDGRSHWKWVGLGGL
jgi:hypothetical protein